MALTQVTGPYPIFTDLDGSPLDDGYLYIGAINDDPETNPIQVFWDSALTIPATQPIRTSNGYAYRNGTPALLYTAGAFSITIRNKRNEFVLYSPVGYGFDPAAVSASVVKNDFIGDGVTVAFVLSAAPSTILATNVFINGVYQEKDSYSLLGNVITFSIAPPLSSSIEVMTNETGVINSGNATAISYTLTAPGAVAQTVQTRLEQYVSINDFGAVGDGVTDDSAAAAACADYCAANGIAMYIPSGTYIVGANQINPTMTSGKNFVLFGSGPTSILKGKAGDFQADYRHIVRLVPNADIEVVEVRDLMIDQNARGSTPPPAPFDYQRSAAILMAANPGFTQDKFICRNVFFKDPVADSIFVAHNSTSTLNRCEVSNISEIDRTRTRHSLTITRLPINTVVSNMTANSIQVEPNSVPTAKVYMEYNNCILEEGFTVDLDSESTAFPGELVVSNVIAKSNFNVAGAVAIVSNCTGLVPSDGRTCSNLLHGSLFSNCRFLLPYDSGTNSITAFNPHYTAETVRGSIAFENCDFVIDSIDDIITPTGYCIYSQSISSSATAWKRNYRLSNCRLDPRAEYGIYLYRNGYWRLDNLVYGGSVAAIRVDVSALRVVDAQINGGDFSKVSGVIIRGGFFAVNQTTDITQIRMAGGWQGISTELFSTSSGNIVNANFFLDNLRSIVLAALPASAVVGDVITLSGRALGEGKSYICTVASVTAPTFRVLAQQGVKRDTTANRPVPSVSDVGLQYLDNTLDADGKAIWWNGTAWVDATGAVV
jgi:hypothetical protein